MTAASRRHPRPISLIRIGIRTMPVSFSEFAGGVRDETAFAVLAIAKRLKAAGKHVIELEIGDSPFPSTPAAKQAGHDAITADQSHYAPSLGIPEMRRAAAEYVRREHGIDAQPENVVVGPGAKIFELLFCEAFLDPGDDVLIFSPYFPTYIPNIQRRGGRVWTSDLKQSNEFRPEPAEVERFLKTAPRPKAIFLNSPHNPTGGVAAEERPGGDRRSDPRHRRRRAQRRAVRPDGVARAAPFDARAARHDGPVRRGVHVQQVVQHERLAGRVCRQREADRRPDAAGC